MKHTFALWALLLAVALPAAAADNFSVAETPVVVSGGAPAEVEISLTSAVPYAGFQFTLSLPAGLSVETVGGSLVYSRVTSSYAEPLSGEAGWALRMVPAASGEGYLALCYNLAGCGVTTGTVPVMRFSLVAASEVTPGTYTGRLSAIQLAGVAGEEVRPADVEFPITVEATPEPTQGSFSITATGLASYYNGTHSYQLPAGVTGAVVTAVNGASVTLDRRFAEGDVVPAATPLLLSGAEADYEFDLLPPEGTTPADNLLQGLDAEGLTQAPDGADAADYRFYKLSLDAAETPGTEGFYWGADDGAPFVSGAHKAYLPVPVALATSRALLFTTTALHAVPDATAASAPLYDLQGRRADTLRRGVYVSAGRKVLVR